MSSCNENEKIYCCTKLYKEIITVDSNNIIHKEYAQIPVLCREICPDECIENELDESLDSQYIKTIVSSCEECLDSSICSNNCAIYFNKNTCSIEEQIVDSLSSAEAAQTETKILIDFIECSSLLLSQTNPSLLNNLLTEQLRKNQSCHKPCCYLLDNDTAGCIKLPETECSSEILSLKLNNLTGLRVINTLVINDTNASCGEVTCFDKPVDPDFSTYINNNNICGVCCLNNSCINICDCNTNDVQNYIQNALGLAETELYDINILAQNGIASAKSICAALQGQFLGYNRSCNEIDCQKTKIITT